MCHSYCTNVHHRCHSHLATNGFEVVAVGCITDNPRGQSHDKKLWGISPLFSIFYYFYIHVPFYNAVFPFDHAAQDSK